MKNFSTHPVSGQAARLFLLCVLAFPFTLRTLAAPAMVQSMLQTIIYPKLNDTLGLHFDNYVREYQFDFSYLAANTPVQDVDVRINLTHTWTGDVHMFLVAPSGLEIPFFEISGCFSTFPINTIFDDEGTASGSCGALGTQDRIKPFNLPGIPGDYLSAFDGEEVSGIWTIRIQDQSPSQSGVIFEVGLEILVDIPIIAGDILLPKKHAENSNLNKLNGDIIETRNAEPTPGFVLFQNEPNPFNSTTTISYNLPAAQPVTLTVFDITGRKILTKQQDAIKGANSMIIQSAEIGATGLLYYRLDTRGYSGTKKMFLAE